MPIVLLNITFFNSYNNSYPHIVYAKSIFSQSPLKMAYMRNQLITDPMAV